MPKEPEVILNDKEFQIILQCDEEGYVELRKLFRSMASDADENEEDFGLIQIARVWKSVKKLFFGKVREI